LGIL
jgi:hypothetical protein